EHLLAGMLADIALALRQRGECGLVGDAAPQPGRNGFLLDLLAARRHAGLAEIFLRQHVGGDLRPLLGHLDVVGMEDDGAVRIADFARGEAKHDVRIRRLSGFGETPLDPHVLAPCPSLFVLAGGWSEVRSKYKPPTACPRRGPTLSAAPRLTPVGSDTPPHVPVFTPGSRPDLRCDAPKLLPTRRFPQRATRVPRARRRAARRCPQNPLWRARRTLLPARRTFES